MRQIFWIFLTVAALALSGCIDLEEDLGQPCSADKLCEPGAESLCGADGVEYACAAFAQCENPSVTVDPTGAACEGNDDDQCEPVTCELYCEYGFKTGDDGCEVCACNDEPPVCSEFNCALACPNGYKTNENGCEICECKEEAPATCENDECVSFYCGQSRGECIRESELATMGACPPTPYQEPAPQCLCGDAGCAARTCAADADCPGVDGLCVLTPDEDRTGYCVNATCAEIRESYTNVAPHYASCQQDSDCEFVSILPSCCGGRAMNSEGAEIFQSIDEFAIRTSCGAEWAEQCAEIRCMPPMGPPRCIEGTCQMPR